MPLGSTLRRPKVKRSRKRRLRMRWALAAALGMAVVIMLSGCFLFNRSPIAKFTVQGGLIHATGEVIAFSGILSMDPDNDELTFRWDFGDGASAVGEQVTHAYGDAGPMQVVLEVSDPSGSTATDTKTLTITEGDAVDGGGGTGPTASFTATPLTGESPLSVSFNASASVYVGHTISAYFWDFGDGVTGTGLTTVHTYAPTTTRSYSVELRIIADDNTEDTASKTITVTIPAAERPSDAPSASFTSNPNEVVAPLLMTFDPSNSAASGDKYLDDVSWWFGDGTTGESDIVGGEAQNVDHRYVTDQAEEEFGVTLLVIDNERATDTESRTVSVLNYQPTAGFQIYDEVQTDGAVAVTGGAWVAAGDGSDAIVMEGTTAAKQTVMIRTQDVNNWAQPIVADPTPLHGETYTPGGYDRDYCYDPEGQGWDGAGDGIDGNMDNPGDAGNYPTDWPNAAWGIETIRVQWGDGVTEYFDYWTHIGDATPVLFFDHEYATWPGSSKTYTITVTAIDFLGGTDSYSRQITLRP